MGNHRKSPSGRKAGDGKPGYKNIDPKHRWKKGGPSPNPGGRRNAAAAPRPSFEVQLWASIRGLIDAPVGLSGPDGTQMTVLEGLLRRILGEAVNDPKIAMKALEWMLSVQRLAANANNESVTENEDDDALIAEALARLSRRSGGGHG